jgi:hypothetical protein
MAEALNGLLKAQRALEGLRLPDYPEIEQLLSSARGEIDQSVSRIVPARLLALNNEHGWSASFDQQMQRIQDTLLTGADGKNAVIGKNEMRKNAPTSFGSAFDKLKDNPRFLEKVEQGFSQPLVVPIGLSPTALKEAMGKAIAHYHSEQKLRSSDGTKLKLDTNEPVWMWDAYKDADVNGSLVYSPQRFDPKDHGGKTKKEIIDESQHSGWQLLFVEDLRDIPREGKGQTVGVEGNQRKQIEANRSPNQYLALMRDADHALEQGLTPEAWQAMSLKRLAETDGEVLDDYTTGAACYCTDAYFPASGVVPNACWRRDYSQALVVGGDADSRDAHGGVRAGVRVY